MTPLRIGVAGLGRAFMLMRPTFLLDARVRLVAAADPRAEARSRFEQEFAGRAYETVDALCADPAVEIVYVATPHELHVAHVRMAAAQGRHVLVEKPMALSVADCRAMVDAARDAGVWLLVGHSHSYDLPYQRTRALIESGAFGTVRMITALTYTDFLYRPRRPEELDTARGGGAVINQAAHQVDIVRLLAGGRVRSVRAATGMWNAARPTEGAYSAWLAFDNGATASLTYSGYGRFDTDELLGGIGEMGQRRDLSRYGEARRRLRGVASGAEEAALRERRGYGVADAGTETAPLAHNHFGFFVVSCASGDLRPLPEGVAIYGDAERSFEALPPPSVPRAEVIDELVAAVRDGVPPLHSGEWGLATVSVCRAILASADAGREIMMEDAA